MTQKLKASITLHDRNLGHFYEERKFCLVNLSLSCCDHGYIRRHRQTQPRRGGGSPRASHLLVKPQDSVLRERLGVSQDSARAGSRKGQGSGTSLAPGLSFWWGKEGKL